MIWRLVPESWRPPMLAQIPRAERAAALAALVTAVGVLAIKFVAYALTRSAAVYSDAIESIVNVIAAVMALYALALAHEPADRQHPYGHGKVEFLSSAIEGGMILLAAGVVAAKAVQAFIEQRAPGNLGLGAIVLGVAGTINGVMGWVVLRRGRASGSPTLMADGRHLVTDAVTSAAVLAALGVFAITRWWWVDPVAAVAAAAYMAYTAWRLVRHSVAGLMDEQDVTDETLLTGLLATHVSGATPPAICGYHKLRHRHVGRMHWVDFHMQVPPAMTVARAHEVATQIEREMERALGEADATAHVEPCPGCGVCEPGEESP